MLRQRVLEQWKNFKERYLKGLDLLDQADDGLSKMGFSTYGSGIEKTPYQVMGELKKKLPSITKDCQELRNKYRDGWFDEPVSRAENIYFTYIELVFVYEKIIEYYDDSQSKPPTIQEVD